MRLIEIESWALRIVDQVARGQPNEDGRVELKTESPTDIPKAARQLAALANPSLGEMVLWIVGVDEKSRTIKGADAQELSNWWNKVEGQFDELAPSMQNIAVNVGGPVVVALAFGTERAPFVVKSATGGQITREVPWREGNRTGSAHRSDLIRLLTPAVRMPSFEILYADFRADRSVSGHFGSAEASMSIYVTPATADRVVFPAHRFSLTAQQKGQAAWLAGNTHADHPRLSTSTSPSQLYLISGADIIVEGPVRFDLRSYGMPTRLSDYEPLRLTASLAPAGGAGVAVLSADLPFTGDTPSHALWKYEPYPG